MPDPIQKRFITFCVDSYQAPETFPDGLDAVVAFSEDERWQEFMLADEWDDYVWQYAPDHLTAIKQHHEKVEQWQKDANHPKFPEKETY